MKLVREHINERFTQDSDPIEDMGIGMMHQIKRWVETETKYKPIDKDLLWICARHGKVDFVKYLLEKSYDVHAEDDLALQSASHKGHVEIVKLLLDAGANVHATDGWALRHASKNGHVEVVKLLLDAGANVHVSNDYALLYASSNGHTEVVKLLLDAGADVHANNDEALRDASLNGHVEVVKLLLDAGANVYAENDNALRWASENGHVEVVKLLLDAGANVHAYDDIALRYASRNGHVEVVKLLKDHIAKEEKQKKIVKENLNEKFVENNSDPIASMGIGGFSFDSLKQGAIITTKVPKIFININNNGYFTSSRSGIDLPIDYPLLVTNVRDYIIPGTKEIKIIKLSNDLETVKKYRTELKNHKRFLTLYTTERRIIINEKKFNRIFKVVERGFEK